ncbi:MAG TPA: DinB family protein, partial [Candidatus Limnocylindria bacterium]
MSTRSVLDAIAAERYDERLPTGNTLREVVAHLAAWEETVPPRVECVLASGTDLGGYDDVDGFNARVFDETRDTSIVDLKARLARSNVAIVDLVRSIEGREVPKLAIDVIEWNTTKHYPDHFPDLGAAMKTAKDVAAAVNQGWVNFRLALMSLGESGLDAKTSVGWTFKQMAMHCAGWEDLTVTRLRKLRETGKPASSDVDTDEFNARMAREADGNSAREVLAALDDAHTRLVREIEMLTPEQLAENDWWAISVIAGNSYGHYGEHHAELFDAVPKRPAQLLEMMREGWRPFRRAVARTGLRHLNDTTSAGWTAKAMLSHLANWLEILESALPYRLRGERGPRHDNQAENDREQAAA